MMISTPRFLGSEERRLLVVPSWDVEYRERFFSRGLDFAGVRFANGETWKSGAAIAWRFDSRDEDDAPQFRGLGDVESTLNAKLFAEWKRSLFSLKTEATHDLLGRGHGLTAALDATVAVPFFRPWFFAAGPGVTWIDDEHARTFFAVDSAQSARSGLPPHAAGAGLRDVHFAVVATRRLPNQWSATTIASLSRLRGDAAESPLTERDTELSVLFIVSRRIR
jgi:outer membrane scaffolding protein for murein synthesis (MipA/OmpV family)